MAKTTKTVAAPVTKRSLLLALLTKSAGTYLPRDPLFAKVYGADLPAHPAGALRRITDGINVDHAGSKVVKYDRKDGVTMIGLFPVAKKKAASRKAAPAEARVSA